MNFKYGSRSDPETRLTEFVSTVALVLVLLVVIGLLFSLVGCAQMSVPADPSRMTAEQLKAVSADRSAVAACTVVAGPWGTGRTIFVQLDKATIPAGAVTVGQDCQVSVTNEGRPVVAGKEMGK